MRKTTTIAFAALAMSAAVEAGETHAATALLSRIDGTYAVKEAEAAAAGMAKKPDAVGGIPDLVLGYELMDFTAPEMASHKLTLRQELPLWGKPRLRRRAAQTEAAAATIMVADRKIETARMIREGLSEYYHARRIRQNRKGELDALRRLTETAKGKYATGMTTLSALTKAEIEAALTESMLSETAAMEAIALNEALDAADVESGDAGIAPFSLRADRKTVAGLKVDDLYAKALARFPGTATAAAGIELAKRRKDLAASELKPDLMLDLSFSLKPADRNAGSLSLGFGVNLPAFSAKAKRAEIAMAELQEAESALRLAGAKNDLHRSIIGALARIADSLRRMDIYETRIRGLRSDDLENLLFAYAVDKADLEMVLDAVRMRYDAEIAYLENSRGLFRSLIGLEYLTGESLVIFEDGGKE